MGDKTRRGGGAPFYVPPKRKTSAEIISEARAAVYGENVPASSGSTAAAGGGALRALRTRRPYTPRDAQRTLFSDRARNKDPRPPSAFNLQYLTLSESSEDPVLTSTTPGSSLDEELLKKALQSNNYGNTRKKNMIRTPPQRSSQNEWSAFAKLPNLSGRSKPLHKRYGQSVDDTSSVPDFGDAVIVTQRLPPSRESSFGSGEHVRASDLTTKRKQYAGNKSQSCDIERHSRVVGDTERHSRGVGDTANVRRLAVNMPNTAPQAGKIDRMGLLELCEKLSAKSRDVDRALLLMEALQTAVEAHTPSTSLLELALRALYTYIDSDDERVIVAIARALFTLCVTGAHLSTACKLVFKVARNDKNDHFFRDTNLLELVVEGCGRAEPVSCSEVCVYGAGALRFLCLEPQLRARALLAGAPHLLALHLKILNNARAENPRGSEQWSHALYQITGALRNLAGGGDDDGATFVSSGAIQELLTTLDTHHTDRDVLTNVVRCLSVLSANEVCCEWLCESETAVSSLISCLRAVAARAALAVRLTYTLGNMAAADDRARIRIFNEEGAMDVLLTVLETYCTRRTDATDDTDRNLVGSDLSGSDGSNEDVLIKTVRVVANVCMSGRAGAALAARLGGRAARALLACLHLAHTARDTNLNDLEDGLPPSSRRLELATATLATLNNLTFYMEPPDVPDLLPDLMQPLCQETCRWLECDRSAACEAVRALGNLTRCRRTAQLLALTGHLPRLHPFLTHEDSAVRCSAAGVLVNVCGAGGGEAASVAGALLAAARARDAECGALLARALWNAAAHHTLTADAVDTAVAALNMFIDDESVFEDCVAAKNTERWASDPSLFKHRVVFEEEPAPGSNQPDLVRLSRARSVDYQLSCDGDDLAEELYQSDECECAPCRRLAAWERVLAVAAPLLEKLRPPRTDAAVGTD